MDGIIAVGAFYGFYATRMWQWHEINNVYRDWLFVLCFICLFRSTYFWGEITPPPTFWASLQLNPRRFRNLLTSGRVRHFRPVKWYPLLLFLWEVRATEWLYAVHGVTLELAQPQTLLFLDGIYTHIYSCLPVHVVAEPQMTFHCQSMDVYICYRTW